MSGETLTLFEATETERVSPGYKQTEVGVIPEDWNAVPVVSMGEVVAGKALAAWAPGLRRPYLRTKNVFDGRIDTSDVLSMPMTDDEFARYELHDGDVLLNEGQTLELVGRCSMYRGEFPEPCAIQNQLVRFRARSGVSSAFASHLFRYCQKTGVFARIALQTTSVAHLGVSRFQKLTLAWPVSEPEQRAIAAALSDADGLISSLDRLISKKRAVKTAAMQQLLTGKRRLPGFSGKWETRQLTDITQTPVTDGPHSTPKFLSDGIPFLSVNNLVENKIDLSFLRYISIEDHRLFSKKCKPKKGDILLGKAASVGNVALVDLDMEFNIWSPIALVRVTDQHVPRFVYYCFQSRNLTRQIELLTNSSSQGNIGMGDIKKLEFILPCIQEQTAIATVLSDMDAELEALEARREKTRRIKQGMMQELLTGRTRLVPAGA